MGDNVYTFIHFCVSPFLNPQSPVEEAYKIAHIRTRYARCFGVLKRRFPSFQLDMALHLKNILQVIVAVLYNMSLEYAEDLPFRIAGNLETATRNAIAAVSFDRRNSHTFFSRTLEYFPRKQLLCLHFFFIFVYYLIY